MKKKLLLTVFESVGFSSRTIKLKFTARVYEEIRS